MIGPGFAEAVAAKDGCLAWLLVLAGIALGVLGTLAYFAFIAT